MSKSNPSRRTVLLTGAAGLGMLAGCGAPPAATPTAQSAGAAASMPGMSASSAAVRYADEACVHHHIKGGFVGPGPDDPLIEQLQRDALLKDYGLNVDLKFESAPWADIDTLITTRLETQGVDSVERDGSSALRWLSQEGLLQDIEDEITQYGPHLAQAYPQTAFDYFTRDGKRYAIANFYTTPVDAEYIHIRRDWLDQIDRDIPQTIEDLEECLRLFKEKKLGGDVTIPISPELGNWLIPAYVLTGPFAPEPDEQLAMLKAGEDFEYEYGSAMRPERLELLQRWHKDGLLHPEWSTLKAEDHNSLVDKSFENYMLSYYGIEGKHWKYAENGAFVDLRTPEPNSEYSGMRGIVWSPQWVSQFNRLPAAPGMEPKDPLVNQRIYGPHFYNRADTTKPQQGEYPTLTRLYHLVAWDFKESAAFEPDFQALRNESATRIIKGELGVADGLKSFWEQWRARGGEQRIKEIGEQYDAYIKANPQMSDPKIFFSPENWNTEMSYPERKQPA